MHRIHGGSMGPLRVAVALGLPLSLFLVTCLLSPVRVTSAEGATPAVSVRRIDSEHLPNLVQLHDRVFSGGLPAGREAFAELQRRGIRTIISVDGARPDVPLAAEFGLRYVHLPHGYDGIPPDRREQLARAIHSLPGPVYVHCHHGKHRSPAAAAAGCVGAGLLDRDAVARVLEVAGTNAGYRGLFRDALASQPLDDDAIRQIPGEFVPMAELPAMTEAMVEIEHRFDLLRTQLSDLRNLSPDNASQFDTRRQGLEHESLLLWENYRELSRLDEARIREPSFTLWLRDGEHLAWQLLESIRGITRSMDTEQAASRCLQRMESNCKACHRQYRDVPRGAGER